MDIQRGDTSQFQSTAVEQSTQGVSSVVDTLFNIGEMVVSTKKQADETKIASVMSQAHTEMYIKNEELKQKYIDNPNIPEFISEFKANNLAIKEKYKKDSGISKLSWNKFDRQFDAVQGSFELSNAEYSIKTNKDNAMSNLRVAISNNAQMASNFGSTGKLDDFVGFVETSAKTLSESSKAVMGEAKSTELLNTYASDMAKEFLGANLKTDPKHALELLKDPRVKKIVNDDKIMQEFKEAAITQDKKQVQLKHYETALNSIKDTDVIGQKLINGEASFSETQEYFLKHKDLPEWEKNILLEMGGFKPKNEDETVEFQDGKLRKSSDIAEEKQNAREAKALQVQQQRDARHYMSLSRQAAADERRNKIELFKLQKETAYSDLTIRGAGLLSGGIATDNKNKINSVLSGVKEYQSDLNYAVSKGLIGKQEWKELSNNYINPLSDYLSTNLKGMEEGFFGLNPMGYNQVKEFVAGLPHTSAGELTNDSKIEKGLVLSNYYEELKKAAGNNKLNSVYDLEKLPSNKQKEVYKTAADNAIKRTKATSTNPYVWFNSDYPAESAAMSSKLNKSSAKSAINNVAKKTYNSDKPVDVHKETEAEIKNHIIKENSVLSNPQMQGKINELKKRGLSDTKIKMLMQLQGGN